MKTLDLRYQSITIQELLQFASQESVLILDENGIEFVLEAADAFEQEVVKLGQSEKFLTFLAERSKEPSCTPLEEIEYRLEQT
jgi:hypothetical protein